MAFDVTGLSEFIQDASKEIAIKAIAAAPTAKMLIDAGEFTAGVKTKARINKLDADVVLQDGSDCGRSPSGSVTLTEKYITVVPLKDEQDFCPKALYDRWRSQMVAKGQNPETETLDAAFVKQFMELRAAKIGAVNEELLWKGDTAGTGNLAKLDGILKLISGNTAITPTGSSVMAKLQSAHSQMDIVVRNQEDYRICIGEDKYEAYLIELDNANKFRPGSEDILTGTRAKFFVTPGLNGTNKIVMGRISDLHLGIDGEGDQDSSSWVYSVETKKWYGDFHYALGIQTVYTENIGYATV